MTSSRLPPRAHMPGPLTWARENLFSSPFNAVLTVVALLVLYWTVVPFVQWAFFDAAFSGADREACLPHSGACWPFVTQRLEQFIYGFYDLAERWRVDVVLLVLACGLIWMTVPGLPGKRPVGGLMLTAFPVVAFVMLVGGFGLERVPTERWGGLIITLVVAITGIVASLPLGIMLALGRRSELPVVKGLSVIFIEFWRGVPLITILFFSSYMLPLFLPGTWTLDALLRVLIGTALFASAYMAEVVRAGLQAIPRGQIEAGQALGLGYWRIMGLIVMPQALRLVIPGIVNTFIGLFKDTTLVLIVAIFDFLGQMRAAFADPNWATPNTLFTGFAFAGIVYFLFCFGMSRYSLFVEHRLKRGR